MFKLEPGIAKFIADNNLVVLRDKNTNKALNVSYSKEGLYWTMNKTGRLLYFEKALLKFGSGTPYFSGTLTKSNKVYVERFVPRTFPNPVLNKIEAQWADKALRLLYGQQS
jgi:hypothetical protein